MFRKTMRRKIWIALVALVVVFTLVVVIKTITYPWRAQLNVTPAARTNLDDNALATHLAEAVRFRTVSYEDAAENDVGELVALRDWLARTYPYTHQALKREIISHHSLLYTWQGQDPSLEPVIFLAHMDVVPVESDSEHNWTHPPFDGVITDGYIWGRGTLDMKAILVGIMEAVEHEVVAGHRPKRTIMLAFGHDEEVGGRNGAANIVRLLKERGVHVQWVLDEGSAIVKGVFPGVQPPVALIGVAEKGYLTIDIVARAPGGHTSMPPYDTAVTRLARAITRLQENPFSGGIDGTVSEMFGALGPRLPFYTRVAIANPWLFAPFLNRILSVSPPLNAIMRTTIAPTMLVGSRKDNVLPSEARATVNLRIHPRDTVESVLTHVRSLFADDPDIRVEPAPGWSINNNPSGISSTNSSGYAIVERTAREIFPDAIVSPYLVIAATDSRHYSEIAKDSYRFGPFLLNADDLDRPHGINERVSVEGFANLVRFYIRLMENTDG